MEVESSDYLHFYLSGVSATAVRDTGSGEVKTYIVAAVDDGVRGKLKALPAKERREVLK